MLPGARGPADAWSRVARSPASMRASSATRASPSTGSTCTAVRPRDDSLRTIALMVRERGDHRQVRDAHDLALPGEPAEALSHRLGDGARRCRNLLRRRSGDQRGHARRARPRAPASRATAPPEAILSSGRGGSPGLGANAQRHLVEAKRSGPAPVERLHLDLERRRGEAQRLEPPRESRGPHSVARRGAARTRRARRPARQADFERSTRSRARVRAPSRRRRRSGRSRARPRHASSSGMSRRNLRVKSRDRGRAATRPPPAARDRPPADRDDADSARAASPAAIAASRTAGERGLERRIERRPPARAHVPRRRARRSPRPARPRRASTD